jgi:hypothetical protein
MHSEGDAPHYSKIKQIRQPGGGSAWDIYKSHLNGQSMTTLGGIV